VEYLQAFADQVGVNEQNLPANLQAFSSCTVRNCVKFAAIYSIDCDENAKKIVQKSQGLEAYSSCVQNRN